MALSLKVVLRKKASQNGTYPLAIRVTIDRKSSYIHLGQNINEADWDAAQEKVKKKHPNSVWLNNLILKKKAEANDKLMEMDVQQKAVSSKIVSTQIKVKRGISFFAQADAVMVNMRKQGKYNRVNSEQNQINVFREFLDDKDIAFPEITISLLNKFKAYLKGTRHVGDRTVANYFILIRTIYNQAIAEGLVDQKHYPFGKGKISVKLPEGDKIGLNADELKALETVDLSASPASWMHARNIWLVALYFAGMRASDVLRLKYSDFSDGRLHYTMGKNNKPGSLKVSEKVLKIIEGYSKSGKYGLVFPELQDVKDIHDTYEVQRKIASVVKRVNSHLQEVANLACIKKPLTMHIARHTFGNLSGDKISIQLLQKLYRHTSITTTIGYQRHFIHKDADEALDAVIGF